FRLTWDGQRIYDASAISATSRSGKSPTRISKPLPGCYETSKPRVGSHTVNARILLVILKVPHIVHHICRRCGSGIWKIRPSDSSSVAWKYDDQQYPPVFLALPRQWHLERGAVGP